MKGKTKEQIPWTHELCLRIVTTCLTDPCQSCDACPLRGAEYMCLNYFYIPDIAKKAGVRKKSRTYTKEELEKIADVLLEEFIDPLYVDLCKVKEMEDDVENI